MNFKPRMLSPEIDPFHTKNRLFKEENALFS